MKMFSFSIIIKKLLTENLNFCSKVGINSNFPIKIRYFGFFSFKSTDITLKSMTCLSTHPSTNDTLITHLHLLISQHCCLLIVFAENLSTAISDFTIIVPNITASFHEVLASGNQFATEILHEFA